MSISEQVKELREYEQYKVFAQNTRRIFKEAADTIEFLSAKLADMERSAEDCGGGWIKCKDRLPETSEYMDFAPNPYMKRLEIAYMTDMVEYTIGYYDGYKWIDKRNREIDNVIAWKPFLKMPEPYHEP